MIPKRATEWSGLDDPQTVVTSIPRFEGPASELKQGLSSRKAADQQEPLPTPIANAVLGTKTASFESYERLLVRSCRHYLPCVPVC